MLQEMSASIAQANARAVHSFAPLNLSSLGAGSLEGSARAVSVEGFQSLHDHKALDADGDNGSS